MNVVMVVNPGIKMENYIDVEKNFQQEDGPAFITNSGNKYWYLNDKEFFSEEEYQKKLFKIRINRFKDLI